MKKFAVWLEGEPERIPTDAGDGNAIAEVEVEAANGFAAMRLRVALALEQGVPTLYVVCVRDLATDALSRWRIPVVRRPELGAAERLP